MKHMVIHCASGIKNTGDEAILSVLIDKYSKEYSLTIISLNREYTLAMHAGVEVLSYADKMKCYAAIEECDIFVLGGGGLLQDTTTIFNVSRWLFYLKRAISKKKRTYIYANSIGPLHYRYNRYICKKCLQKVSKITVRDYESAELLKELQIECEVTADPVFSIRETDFLNGELKKKLPSQYVTIAIRHWFDTIPFIPVAICTKFGIRRKSDIQKYNRYIFSIQEMVKYINDVYKLPVVFLSFCYERDAKVARDILNTPKLLNENIIINEEFMPPGDFMHIIKNARLLIGMRLHSLIYALNVSCPFVSILYEEKVKSLIKMIQMTEWAVDVESITANELIDKVDSVLCNRESIILRNKEVLRKLQVQESKNDI